MLISSPRKKAILVPVIVIQSEAQMVALTAREPFIHIRDARGHLR